jgi:SAM-dependent methyltransferase
MKISFSVGLLPVNREFFKDKVVLEGGCGKGRHTQLAAQFGARDVIGVDLSDAVETAFAATRHLPNAHIVQTDIFNLPFARAFDYAFSVGVLHHLPDPRGGFKSLVSKVKPGGHMSAWILRRREQRVDHALRESSALSG